MSRRDFFVYKYTYRYTRLRGVYQSLFTPTLITLLTVKNCTASRSQFILMWKTVRAIINSNFGRIARGELYHPLKNRPFLLNHFPRNSQRPCHQHKQFRGKRSTRIERHSLLLLRGKIPVYFDTAYALYSGVCRYIFCARSVRVGGKTAAAAKREREKEGSKYSGENGFSRWGSSVTPRPLNAPPSQRPAERKRERERDLT